MRLGPAAEAEGYRLIALDETPSTNDEARLRAQGGDPGRLWIVAAEQKAGRGRHGRTWSSPPGNLYASLLLMDPCARPLAAQLGFVAGLAAHDAIMDLTGLAAGRLTLKWPNDLLLDGAKVSGLLLEGIEVAGHFGVIIGLGLNIRHAPTGTPYPAAKLADIAGDLTPAHLFPMVSDALARRLATWRAGAGFADIRSSWLARAAGLGQTVTVRLPEGDMTGTFRGLDPDGRLELATGGTVRRIDAGDLFFGATGADSRSRKQV